MEDAHAASGIQPVYLFNGIRLGPFQDVEVEARKLWWWGPLRRQWTYFKTALKCRFEPVHVRIEYRDPCPGCQACLNIGKRVKKKSNVVEVPSSGSRYCTSLTLI